MKNINNLEKSLLYLKKNTNKSSEKLQNILLKFITNNLKNKVFQQKIMIFSLNNTIIIMKKIQLKLIV